MWSEITLTICLALVTSQEPLNCAGLKYVSKEEWHARPVASVTETQTIPIPNIFIHKTNTSCTDQKTCSNVMRVIQAQFMDKNKYHDIAYHFVIGADGAIYEGRGWFLRGALEDDFNMKSLSFAYIGKQDPSSEMKNLKDQLITCGKDRNFIQKEAEIKELDKVDTFATADNDPISNASGLTGSFPVAGYPTGATYPTAVPSASGYPPVPAYQLVMTPSGYYQVIPVSSGVATQQSWMPQGQQIWPQQQQTWPQQQQQTWPQQQQQQTWPQQQQTWPQQQQYPTSGQYPLSGSQYPINGQFPVVGSQYPISGQYPTGAQQVSSWQNPLVSPLSTSSPATIVVIPYPFTG